MPSRWFPMTTTSSVMLPGMTPIVFQIGMTFSSTGTTFVSPDTLRRNLDLTLHTVVQESDRSIFRVIASEGSKSNLSQENLCVRPRDRQARYLGYALAFQTCRILVRWIPGRGGVARVDAQELHRATLQRCRVPCGTVRVPKVGISFGCTFETFEKRVFLREVSVRSRYRSVVARVVVNEHTGSTEVLRALDLEAAEDTSVASNDNLPGKVDTCLD
jgi:hypothetical protein